MAQKEPKGAAMRTQPLHLAATAAAAAAAVAVACCSAAPISAAKTASTVEKQTRQSYSTRLRPSTSYGGNDNYVPNHDDRSNYKHGRDGGANGGRNRNLLAADGDPTGTNSADGDPRASPPSDEADMASDDYDLMRKVLAERSRAKALYELTQAQGRGDVYAPPDDLGRATTEGMETTTTTAPPESHLQKAQMISSASNAASVAQASTTSNSGIDSRPGAAHLTPDRTSDVPLQLVLLERHRRRFLDFFPPPSSTLPDSPDPRSASSNSDYSFDYKTTGNAPGASLTNDDDNDDSGQWIKVHVINGKVGYVMNSNSEQLPDGDVVDADLPTMEDMFRIAHELFEGEVALVGENEEDKWDDVVKVEYDGRLAYITKIEYEPPVQEGGGDGRKESMSVLVRNLRSAGDDGYHDHIVTTNTVTTGGPEAVSANPNDAPLDDNDGDGTEKIQVTGQVTALVTDLVTAQGQAASRTPKNRTPTVLDNLAFNHERWRTYPPTDYDYVLSMGKRRKSAIKIQVRNGSVVSAPPTNGVGALLTKFLSCLSEDNGAALPTMDEVYDYVAASYKQTPKRRRRGTRIRYNSEVGYPTYVRIPLSCGSSSDGGGGLTKRNRMITFEIRNVNIIKEGGSGAGPELVNPDPDFDDKLRAASNKWTEKTYSGDNLNYWFKYKRGCEAGMPDEDCRAMCVTATNERVTEVRYAMDDPVGKGLLSAAESICDSTGPVPEDLAESIPSIAELLELMQSGDGGGRTISGTFDETWGYPRSGHIVDRPDTPMPFRFEIQDFDLIYTPPPSDEDGPQQVSPGNLLPNGCDAAPMMCDDGKKIYKRGIPPNCVYPPCDHPGVHDPSIDGPLQQPPRDSEPTLGSDGNPLACRTVIKLCDDGETYVSLDPTRDCLFWQRCPGEGPDQIQDNILPNGCDATPKQCENGDIIYKRGIPPDGCAYPPCDPPGVYDPDVDAPLQQPPAPDSASSRPCPLDLRLCGDGATYVARDPDNDCAFQECPDAPQLVSATPGGLQGGAVLDNRLRPVRANRDSDGDEFIDHARDDRFDFVAMDDPSK